MSKLFKPLTYYVRKYLAVERGVTHNALPLVDAKEQLDALDAEYNSDNSRSPDRLVLADLTEPNQLVQWTSQDGSRQPVGAMTTAHLYYALAKAERGEYIDCASAAAGVQALRIEAFRRLRNTLCK